MKYALISLLASLAIVPAVSQITCTTDTDCTDGRPKCCGGFCVGCCEDADCPDHQTCQSDGVCYASCFSGESIVDILGKGSTPMKELEVGDRVQARDSTYEKVYAFGHREPEVESYFLQIYLEGQKEGPLEITANHLLLHADSTSPVPASTIKLGDKLVLANGQTAPVTKISGISREGIYAPLSKSGLVAVNGVVASSYVTAQPGASHVKIGEFSTPFSWQWVSHTFQAPHRFVCDTGFAACENASGTPFQVDLIESLNYWMSNQRSWWIQYMVVPVAMVPAVIVLASMQVVELLFNYRLVGLTFVAAWCLTKVMKTKASIEACLTGM